ncbi:MAG TPA: hypothetical protein DHV22_10315 [Xanthomarina gelatinilytica]|uniref:Uncharacterized protein n=1 Tax=Xanthomarina gelatinilytica TaxID=1137281 RepID=A0A3D6BRT6_9FLAO|nr:hypothetical protein [Xanthomarina gelatinilytica]
MKKADLKKVIKPLVKECIQEVLLEEGLLSNIVSEVATGLQGNVIVENNKNVENVFNENSQRKEEQLKKLSEQKRKMLDAIGRDAFNGVDLFEGTTPAPAQKETTAGSVDLGNPGDSGVDISSLIGGASKIWGAMK